MKKLIRSTLLLTIICLSLFVTMACQKSDANNNEKAIVTNESTTSPEKDSTETSDESKSDEDVTANTTDVDSNTQNSSTNKKATTAPTKKVTQATKENTSNTTSSNTSVVFDDFLNPQEYKVTKTGTYTISCNPSDNKASWDIYVLDEPFDDALRYLTSAYTPTAKAEAKARTITLKAGQYLYAICSENSLTFEGDKSTFKCPLTIAAK